MLLAGTALSLLATFSFGWIWPLIVGFAKPLYLLIAVFAIVLGSGAYMHLTRPPDEEQAGKSHR